MLARVIAIGCVLVVWVAGAPIAAGEKDKSASFTTLDVQGEQARIYRDEFGVPHIFAETNRGLFEAYGYVVAEDRLWQAEVNRRARRGRLAEILGPSALVADRNTRSQGLTDAELDSRFAALNAEAQEIMNAYVDGLNRYVRDVVAPDPFNKLPFEFHSLNIGLPVPWEVRDVVGFLSGFAVSPPNSGAQEIPNQSLLASLIAAHGPEAGLAIFNDVRFLNDPDAPVNIPTDGAFGKIQKAHSPHLAQLQGAALHSPEPDTEVEARAMLESLGVPIKFGSHGWVISAAKSAEGSAMLFGGPQFPPAPNLTDVAPALVHEVQLTGGNGFRVRGMAFAGVPIVAIGRTDHIAWTTTTAAAIDNTDIYIETLCASGTGYMFNGACTPFQSRVETISVKGSAPVQLRVLRSLHGPVVPPSMTTASGTCVTVSAPGFCFTRKRVFSLRGLEEFEAFLTINRAHNLQQFEAGMSLIVAGWNFLYADKIGNIGYWQAGLVPVRPAGFDLRLPLPGDGSAEWTGEFLPMPKSINPTRGWLADWNSKPSIDWNNPDHQTFGKQHRVLEIQARLSGSNLVSLADMRNIALDIARTIADVSGSGRPARFLKPYLLKALDMVPPSHPLGAQARTVLESWDGSQFADAVSSTHREPGDVIFSKWLDIMRVNTFGDELGANVSAGTPNVLIHVLDDALGGGSSVPPSRNYFNSVDPNVVISASFDQALAALGPDPAAWSTQPRATVRFRHTLLPAIPEIGSMPDSNRGTYAQIVVLSNPRISAENIFTLGQSGFIGLGPSNTPVFDPHFRDQLELYRNFQYKPMRLYWNIQLQE